jgi:hypothetical protein
MEARGHYRTAFSNIPLILTTCRRRLETKRILTIFTQLNSDIIIYVQTQRPGREVDHSPPSGNDVNNEWRCTSTPLIRLHAVDRDSFTFAFYL